jgi:hypothetical protein
LDDQSAVVFFEDKDDMFPYVLLSKDENGWRPAIPPSRRQYRLIETKEHRVSIATTEGKGFVCVRYNFKEELDPVPIIVDSLGTQFNIIEIDYLDFKGKLTKSSFAYAFIDGLDKNYSIAVNGEAAEKYNITVGDIIPAIFGLIFIGGLMYAIDRRRRRKSWI